jgi:hypothetical protein
MYTNVLFISVEDSSGKKKKHFCCLKLLLCSYARCQRNPVANTAIWTSTELNVDTILN